MTSAGAAVAAVSAACPGCGTAVAATLLSCPGCHRLVHADALKAHASRAEAALRANDYQTALVAWRASLDLLPPGSRQHAWVAERITAVAAQAEQAGAPPAEIPSTGRWKWLAALGPAALLVWKFKFLVVALLSKGKLLLLGLTKASTLGSMFLAVGVYWTQWGLWFALGLVISIYIHEMGHVAALRRYGIAATAPMFIPGFGALIRLKQRPVSAREDARIGLAGPLWGLGAAAGALVIAILSGNAFWAAIARTGAWLNLFNLTPVWQLDGSHAFGSLTTAHRWIATTAVAAAWMMTGDGVLILVLLMAIARSAAGGSSVAEDRGALWQYVGITLALAVIFRAARTLL